MIAAAGPPPAAFFGGRMKKKTNMHIGILAIALFLLGTAMLYIPPEATGDLQVKGDGKSATVPIAWAPYAGSVACGCWIYFRNRQRRRR